MYRYEPLTCRMYVDCERNDVLLCVGLPRSVHVFASIEAAKNTEAGFGFQPAKRHTALQSLCAHTTAGRCTQIRPRAGYRSPCSVVQHMQKRPFSAIFDVDATRGVYTHLSRGSSR